MNEVVFVVNSIKQARCIRRIEDFIKNGYTVYVYGFDRSDDKRKLPNLDVVILGKIKNRGNYLNRFLFIREEIKEKVIKKHDKRKTIFYLFNFDVALAFLSVTGFGGVKYIYEVSDLTELTISNKIIRRTLVYLNKKIMINAFENVFTSEGFSDYYFKKQDTVGNITLLQNKLSQKCLELPFPQSRDVDIKKIKIGFTGVIRFETIYNFTKVIADNFLNIEMHFFGIISEKDPFSIKIRDLIENRNNIFFHGPFNNPDDFPEIYSQIDMVLALYTPSLGVKFAEPNKLFEAIFYEKPIIVSESTFLGEKVEKLDVGFVVNGINQNEIRSFLNTLTVELIEKKSKSCKEISKKESIDDPSIFFDKIKKQ